MFQRFFGSTAIPASRRTKRAINRAVFLTGCLLLLWVLVEVVSLSAPLNSAPTASPPTASAEATAAPSETHDLGRADNNLFGSGYVLVWVLLAAGGGLAWYLRRRNPAQQGQAALMQSLGEMALAPNQQLKLVTVGEDVLLLGVTSGQITLLKEYDRAAFAEVAPQQSSAAQASFASVLQHMTGHAAEQSSVPTSSRAFASLSS